MREAQHRAAAAGLTGPQLAAATGIAPSVISRLDNDRAMSKPADIERLFPRLEAPATERRALLDLAASLQTDLTAWRLLQSIGTCREQAGTPFPTGHNRRCSSPPCTRPSPRSSGAQRFAWKHDSDWIEPTATPNVPSATRPQNVRHLPDCS